MIQGYLDEAVLPADLGPVRAIIAPHAGYIYSGPIAGYAFKALSTIPDRRWTVYLLGPAHRAYFSGVALGTYSAFTTPLGEAPVDVDRVAELLVHSDIFVRGSEAHTLEHALEVEIPFIQTVLSDFRLVPMLFGQTDPGRVASHLADWLDDDALIVVSSDLSHYLPYAIAGRRDRALLSMLIAGERERLETGEACGRAPMVTLMDIARCKGWRPILLDYRSSGDTAGDKTQVVGYGAVAYTE